jgi:diketogulonate reductase-like aldo/keto reductase
MQQLPCPDGPTLPALGLGTAGMGEQRSTRPAEVQAVRSALELGYRLIDSAEMYGEGGAEQVVGEALASALRGGVLRREEVCVVSKVYPHNASRAGTLAACERSRQRLGLDRIDLYLLHWRGQHPLRDTVAALQSLVAAGHIGAWGVSNFNVADMGELSAVVAASGGPGCATNQVYYSPSERGPEFDLLPWMRQHAMPLMAYSPIDQGRLAWDATLAAIGAPRGLTAAQVALAWVMSQPGVLAIPKAVSLPHLRQNLAAAGVKLDAAERQQIDQRFPPPTRSTPLAMI